MKRIYLSLIALALLVALPSKTLAQLDDAGDILRGGAHDANLLMSEYLKPFGSGFGAGLNSGWVNSAKPYGKFGFDLRVSASLSFVPDADRSFDITSLALQELEHLGGPTVTPTAFGEEASRARVGKRFFNPETGQDEELFSFDMPEGAGIAFVPSPMAQLTVGLVQQTDLSFRFFPSMRFGDEDGEFRIGMWGLGIKHGLDQWIDYFDAIPVDLSIQLGYTRITMRSDFDVEPDEGPEIANPYPDVHWDGQGLELISDGFTGNLLVGRQFPIITLFAGVGVQRSLTTVTSTGAYPIVTPLEPEEYEPGGPVMRIDSVEEPIDISLQTGTHFQGLAGLRIRLAVVTISASYTLARYNNLNVGVGLSFR